MKFMLKQNIGMSVDIAVLDMNKISLKQKSQKKRNRPMGRESQVGQAWQGTGKSEWKEVSGENVSLKNHMERGKKRKREKKKLNELC